MRRTIILSGAIILVVLGAGPVYAQAPVDPYGTQQHTGVITPKADEGQSESILPEQGASEVGPEDQPLSPHDKRQNFGPAR